MRKIYRGHILTAAMYAPAAVAALAAAVLLAAGYDVPALAAAAFAVAWVVGAAHGLPWLFEPALQAALADDDEGDRHV